MTHGRQLQRVANREIETLSNGRVRVTAVNRQRAESFRESLIAALDAGECAATPTAIAEYFGIEYWLAASRLRALVRAGVIEQEATK